jgi:hypothetical protein
MTRVVRRRASQSLVDTGVELVANADQKVAAIALELKREQIVGERPFMISARHGRGADPMRPRDVPEEDVPNGWLELAEIRSEQRQVIVLMNTEVWRSVSSSDTAAANRALTRWPPPNPRCEISAGRGRYARAATHLVREAVVVTTFFLGREPDPSAVRRLVRRNDDPVVRVDHVRVGVTPAVCDPGPSLSRISASGATDTPPVVGATAIEPSSAARAGKVRDWTPQ